jgi:tRNA(fMet)-specific endonuclease VapC
MLRYLLDTNICIFTIKNRPAPVRARFQQFADQLCISSITWMELVYGAERSASPQHNLAIAEGLAARLALLDYNADAAAHTGEIRVELASRGTPIGPYDQMIAGHARSHGLILVTNNTREFERVSGLRLEDWTQP